MRRLLLGFFGVVAVVGFMLPGVATPVAAKGEKVTICHFPGHDGDVAAAADGSCSEGNPITISESAACNGHGVADACPAP